MSNELINNTSLDLSKPEQSLIVADTLQRFVKSKNLTSNIRGKEYPQVEAWQFAGSQLGLYPLLTEVNNLSNDNEIKFAAWVEIRRIADDRLMSRGYATCSNKESTKKLFDEYAICSMAQTRAEGKAFRMLLSWLMKAAGFESTPAEEMDFEHTQTNEIKPPKRAANGEVVKTTMHNHKELGTDEKPLISNADFKQLCEDARHGLLGKIQDAKQRYSFDHTQQQLINQLYLEATKQTS